MMWNEQIGISAAGYRRLLEEVLDRDLTEEQVKQIIRGWKAFAADPVKYAGTLVIEMVQLDLDQP